MDKDAFYFPHFSNARIDRKIRRVRKELGIEGYGIYFMLLETLREQQGFKFPIQDLDLLADEFGTSEQKVRTVVTNYQLFKVDEGEEFFSPKFNMYLKPYLEGKERKRIAGIRGNLIRYKHITKEQSESLRDKEIIEIHGALPYKKALSSHSDSHSDSTSSQSKLNESKQINKIDKVNNKIKYFKCEDLPYFHDPEFQELWEAWNKVRKKKKASFEAVAFTKIHNKLERWAGGDINIAMLILEKSILSGWSDIYEIKELNKSNTADKWKGDQNFEF